MTLEEYLLHMIMHGTVHRLTLEMWVHESLFETPPVEFADEVLERGGVAAATADALISLRDAGMVELTDAGFVLTVKGQKASGLAS